MLGSSILDVAIGMAFIYLLLSLIASTILEALSAIAQARAANLEHGIRSLFSGGTFDGTCFVKLIYQHGLVRGLYQDSKYDDRHAPASLKSKDPTPSDPAEPKHWFREAVRTLLGVKSSHFTEEDVADPFYLPAYIPARTFSTSLMAILNTEKKDGKDFLEAVKAKLEAEVIPKPAPGTSGPHLDNKAAEALLALVMDALNAKEPVVRLRTNIENWYNDGMDRVSGWYKKHTQIILLFIGIGIAVAFNVDSIQVARTLWFNRDIRQGIVDAATNYTDANKTLPQTITPEDLQTLRDTKNPKDTKTTSQGTDQAATQPPPQTDAQPSTQSDAQTGAKTDANPPSQPKDAKALAQQIRTSLDAFDTLRSEYLLPVGWKYPFTYYKSLVSDVDHWNALHILAHLAGWFVTALALSLGAPFWFDTLNKFMVVRSTVKPQEKSKDEPSKS